MMHKDWLLLPTVNPKHNDAGITYVPLLTEKINAETTESPLRPFRGHLSLKNLRDHMFGKT